jgi:pyrimidine nucleoside transport protein
MNNFDDEMVLILSYDWLQFIIGKVFIPLAWIMGVKWEECEEVARLVGVKTVVNEFVAYQQMGESKRAGLLSVSMSTMVLFHILGNCVVKSSRLHI